MKSEGSLSIYHPLLHSSIPSTNTVPYYVQISVLSGKPRLSTLPRCLCLVVYSEEKKSCNQEKWKRQFLVAHCVSALLVCQATQSRFLGPQCRFRRKESGGGLKMAALSSRDRTEMVLLAPSPGAVSCPALGFPPAREYSRAEFSDSTQLACVTRLITHCREL